MKATVARSRFLFLLLTGLIAFIALGSSAAYSQELGLLGEDVIVPVPEGWVLLGDSTGFPAQLLFTADSAEILFFRSELGGEDMIDNETELQQSVELVAEDVISSLPSGQLLTSTGFFEQFRAGFTLEFSSTDSATGVPLEHSLRGILYRHPEKYQLLFTIWGKAAVTTFPIVQDDILRVQTGFTYQGDYVDNVFVPAGMSYWPIILILMAIVGVFLLRPLSRRRRQPGSNDSPA